MSSRHDMDTHHLGFIEAVCDEDKAGLMKAEAQYKGSWKRRGGIGAYMMLCRKWDRIENKIEEDTAVTILGKKTPLRKAWDYLADKIKGALGQKGLYGEQDLAECLGILEATRLDERYDIFAKIAADDRAEGLIDDIRDLRRYLVLVEAEMRARGSKGANSVHRDNVEEAV